MGCAYEYGVFIWYIWVYHRSVVLHITEPELDTLYTHKWTAAASPPFSATGEGKSSKWVELRAVYVVRHVVWEV